MRLEILISFTVIAVIFTLITSIINFISTIKEFKKIIDSTNHNIPVDQNINVLNNSLSDICRDIYSYFIRISPDNNYTVKIFHISKNDKEVTLVASCPQVDFYSSLIKDNSEFYQTTSTKKPYYINNIPYFKKHGNNYFTSNYNWEKYYQSIICYPIKQKSKKRHIYNIIGFLVVEIAKPLNDLIDINIILDYMKQKCDIIILNNEFNGEKDNPYKIGWNIDNREFSGFSSDYCFGGGGEEEE